MSTPPEPDRISRLEGSYEHVATKADIANLKADIERAKWQIILAVGGIVGTDNADRALAGVTSA